MNNILETDSVRLRALEPEDIDVLYKWENDTRIWKMSNTVAPFSKYVLRRFIEDQKYDIYETKQLRMIIESRGDGRAVGAIDLFEIDPTNRRAGIGILVYEDRDRGQGYASCALTSMIKYAFQVLGLNQALLQCALQQPAQSEPFQKQGLHYGRSEGGVGAFHDRMAGRIHASTGQSRQGVGGETCGPVADGSRGGAAYPFRYAAPPF